MGHPNKVAEYAWMRTYSPRQPQASAYPAVLARTAINDSQVPYWPPSGWPIRTLNSSSGPVLYDINMTAGHGGASGRFDALRGGAHRRPHAPAMGLAA